MFPSQRRIHLQTGGQVVWAVRSPLTPTLIAPPRKDYFLCLGKVHEGKDGKIKGSKKKDLGFTNKSLEYEFYVKIFLFLNLLHSGVRPRLLEDPTIRTGVNYSYA